MSQSQAAPQASNILNRAPAYPHQASYHPTTQSTTSGFSSPVILIPMNVSVNLFWPVTCIHVMIRFGEESRSFGPRLSALMMMFLYVRQWHCNYTRIWLIWGTNLIIYIYYVCKMVINKIEDVCPRICRICKMYDSATSTSQGFVQKSPKNNVWMLYVFKTFVCTNFEVCPRILWKGVFAGAGERAPCVSNVCIWWLHPHY